jgi:hypothetical protein
LSGNDPALTGQQETAGQGRDRVLTPHTYFAEHDEGEPDDVIAWIRERERPAGRDQ